MNVKTALGQVKVLRVTRGEGNQKHTPRDAKHEKRVVEFIGRMLVFLAESCSVIKWHRVHDGGQTEDRLKTSRRKS